MKIIFLIVAVLALILFSCEKEENLKPLADESEMLTSAIDDNIPGKYIVLLKGGASALKSAYQDVEARNDMVIDEANDVLQIAGITDKELDKVYSSSIRGFALSLSEEEALVLAKQPGVRGVWQDRIITLKKPGTVPVDPPD